MQTFQQHSGKIAQMSVSDIPEIPGARGRDKPALLRYSNVMLKATSLTLVGNTHTDTHTVTVSGLKVAEASPNLMLTSHNFHCKCLKPLWGQRGLCNSGDAITVAWWRRKWYQAHFRFPDLNPWSRKWNWSQTSRMKSYAVCEHRGEGSTLTWSSLNIEILYVQSTRHKLTHTHTLQIYVRNLNKVTQLRVCTDKGL